MHIRWRACWVMVLVCCVLMPVGCFSGVVTAKRAEDTLLRSEVEREVTPRVKWFASDLPPVDAQTGSFEVLVEAEDLCLERDVDLIQRVAVSERSVNGCGWTLAGGVASTVTGGILLGAAPTLSDARDTTTVTDDQGQKEEKEVWSPQTTAYVVGSILTAGGVGALSYLGYQAYESIDTCEAPVDVRIAKDERTVPCNRQPMGAGISLEVRIEPSQQAWRVVTSADGRIVLDGARLAESYITSAKPRELQVLLVTEGQEIARLSYPATLEGLLAPRRSLVRREQLKPLTDLLSKQVMAGKSFDADTVKPLGEAQKICQDNAGLEDLCGVTSEVFACYAVKKGGSGYVRQWEQLQKVFQDQPHQKLTVTCLKQLAKDIEPAYKEALKAESLAAVEANRAEAQQDALEYAYQEAQEVYDRRAEEREALIEELDEASARVLEPATIKLCRRLIPELKKLIKEGKVYAAKHPDEGVPEHIDLLISAAQEDYQLAEGIFKHIGLMNPGDQSWLQGVFARECSMD